MILWQLYTTTLEEIKDILLEQSKVHKLNFFGYFWKKILKTNFSKYISGQFIHACVVITPLDQGSNRVEIQCKPELNEPLEHIKVRK